MGDLENLGSVLPVPLKQRSGSVTPGASSKEQYKALYVALDAALVARGLRDQIGLIGGDLVQNADSTAGGHRAWFEYMVTNMNDVIDAWSEHIYRNYWDHLRMEERLKDVAHLVGHEFPASAQKPTLLLEYGRPRDEQLRDQADRDGGVLVTRGRRGALWQAGLWRRVAPP